MIRSRFYFRFGTHQGILQTCRFNRPLNSGTASPTRLFIERRLGKPAQRVNRAPISLHRLGRKQRPGRLIHEGHKLVREARHGATNADAAYVWTSAHAAHPSTLSDIALDDRSPASEFYDALGGSVFLSKFSLLIISASITALMQSATEEPSGSQRVVQRNHWSATHGHVEEI